MGIAFVDKVARKERNGLQRQKKEKKKKVNTVQE